MYRALYREYRPEVFDEIIGQDHIVKVLKSQVAQDSVSHAYLFCGTRGTGKTTTARLIAKAVNCLSDWDRPCGVCENCRAIKEGTFMDLMEIDAASNNGIDNIRELRESIKYPPSVGRKKVYIIDEVHMLSTAAFNAFLKTLEEPPDNVMFILATTEPQKLPQTILSRCIRMDFRRVSEKQIFERMELICEKRNVEIDKDALWLVAANADGSVRDGLTLLDQCISGREGYITRDDILDTLGAVGEETYIRIVDAIIEKNVSGCIMAVEDVMNRGRDARQVLMGLMNHYRNLLMAKYVEKPETVLNMSLENVQRLKEQSLRLAVGDINEGIIELSRTGSEISYTTQPRILLELAVVKLATGLTSRKLSPCIDEKGGNMCTLPDGRIPQKNAGKPTAVQSAAPAAVSPVVSEVPQAKPSAGTGTAGPADSLFPEDHMMQGGTVGQGEAPSAFSAEAEGMVAASGRADGKNDREASPGPAHPAETGGVRTAEPEQNADQDMEEVWDEVCRRASDVKFELVVLGRNSYPRKMSEGELVVSVTNAIAGGLVEKHRNVLMDAVEEITGTRKHIVLAGKEEQKEDVSRKETAEKVHELLGIDVKLTD